MKQKQVAGVIVKHRPSDNSEESSELSDIEAAIQDFMKALEAKDIKRMAEIVKIAHDLLHEHMDNEAPQEEASGEE